MKKQFSILAVMMSVTISVYAQEIISKYLEETKKSIVNAQPKKMIKVANALNHATRSAIKKVLGDTYKTYRGVYVKEETARWHAGTNKVKDKTLSKDEKTLANALLKTENKLNIVVREKYGDIQNIITLLKEAVEEIISK